MTEIRAKESPDEFFTELPLFRFTERKKLPFLITFIPPLIFLFPQLILVIFSVQCT